MVIERALEKMRRASDGKVPEAARSTGGETGKHQALAKAVRPTQPRPVFPTMEVSRVAAETHRVLLPDAQIGDATHVGASYRMLRTRLLHRLRSNHWRSLAITSPGAGEGKSLTALNLALSVARDQATEVFLLDLDMRNPSICAYLGVRPSRELLHYFGGVGEPSETFFSIGIPNLALAGQVTASDQASELMTNGRLEGLLDYIWSIATNPVVVIDLPPVLVTDEALLVAPKVDATALVVTEGRTRRDSLARARQLLVDYTFAGVILNRSTESFGVDSYYGYGYGDRYAAESKA